MKISVTGYEGKERTYVKDMIRVIGAVYTGELSQVSFSYDVFERHF